MHDMSSIPESVQEAAFESACVVIDTMRQTFKNPNAMSFETCVSAAVDIAAAHGWNAAIEAIKPHTVTTVEELDALNLDAVVVESGGCPRTKRAGNSHMGAGWTHAGTSPLRSTELADGRPMTVVFEGRDFRRPTPATNNETPALAEDQAGSLS